MEPAYLFVYGTLRSGAATKWSQFLFGASRFIGTARARGTLFELDGYPGMTAASEGDSWVVGEVYLLEDPAVSLPVLDAYEGPEYKREPIGVELEDGKAVQAWLYLYVLDTGDKVRIASGDYLQP